MRFELFPYGEGFGYNIYNDTDAIVVSQNFHPKEPGFVYMDESVATEMAKMDMATISGSSTDESVTPTTTQEDVQKYSSFIGYVNFLMRLTPTERKEFNRLIVQVEIDYAEAVKAGSVPETLDDVYDFLNMFKKTSYIDLSFEPTIQGVTWIGMTFLGMSAERVSEILKY